MAKVRRASPKSSSPPPPLQHRAKWRPNAKRQALPRSLCLPAHFTSYFTPRADCPSLRVAVALPHSPFPTRLHATTFQLPHSPPSAVGDFGFQIVFVLLLSPTPPKHHPSLVDFIYSAQTRHFVLLSGALTLCQRCSLPQEACGERYRAQVCVCVRFNPRFPTCTNTQPPLEATAGREHFVRVVEAV